jgi:hypothetical protein
MSKERENKFGSPQPLGGHAIPLGLLFPRWLGVSLVLVFAAISGIALYYLINFVAGLF